MRLLSHLFANNRAWAAEITRTDPEFFERLAAQQAPQYLWIGCSDSRVPANQITGLLPGEMFVHRNVANLVVHSDLNCLSTLQFAVDVLNSDLNCLSTLQFAVDVLKVRHVIVCGHYGCGGVLAALRDDRLGLVDDWLQHVRDLKHRHPQRLSTAKTEKGRHDLLCELNVIEQVVNVCETTVVRAAWARGQELAVNGCIYDIHDGLLRDLGISVTAEHELPAAADAARSALGER